MGNKQSCCVYGSPRSRNKTEEKYLPAAQADGAEGAGQPSQRPPTKEASATNLQHISEREPDGVCLNMKERKKDG